MSDLLDSVISYEPVVSGVSVPLRSNVIITLLGTDYDETSLLEGFFLEGPSGDQWVGPGILPLEYPEGIPDEDLRDILDSAVDLVVPIDATVTVVSGVNTVVTLNPTYPLQANTIYRVNLTDVLERDGITAVSGFISWPFTTGSGSIEELPVEISTSILASAPQGVSAALAVSALKVVKTTPSDHAIQQDPSLEEIEIEFNKDINANSVPGSAITVKGLPATDHPSANITSSGDLYKAIEVVGNKIKLKI